MPRACNTFYLLLSSVLLSFFIPHLSSDCLPRTAGRHGKALSPSAAPEQQGYGTHHPTFGEGLANGSASGGWLCVAHTGPRALTLVIKKLTARYFPRTHSKYKTTLFTEIMLLACFTNL
jgi:hypothetical protein